MKRLAVAFLAIAVLATTSFAAGSARQNTGCGLGTVLWKNSADGSTMSQALQATTNGSFGSQTFGITSGTLECGEPSHFADNERLKEFVVANMDNLAKDIASGSGESLSTFTELLQIPADQRVDFDRKLQSSFSGIFTHDKIVYAELMDNVATVTAIK
jgi:hypothetical protein